MMISPIEFNVVVRQDPVNEKTKGGLFIPENQQDREKHQAMRGTLVAISPMAFSDIWPDDMPPPEVGARVLFAKHSGTLVEEDGEELRIMKDKDILAVLA